LFLDEKTLWPDGKYVTTHLVVSRNILQKNRNLVRKLLAAHVSVTKKLNGDRSEAGRILNAQLKVETGKSLKEETITRALSRVEFTWDPVQSSLAESAESAHKIGFIRVEPKLDGIYELALLNEVLGEQQLPQIAAK
jgi:NitT/TauT family transport system substrate-binding protein